MEYQSWEEYEAARKQKAKEFEQAKHAVFMAICNALRIPQIVEWLNKVLSRIK